MHYWECPSLARSPITHKGKNKYMYSYSLLLLNAQNLGASPDNPKSGVNGVSAIYYRTIKAAAVLVRRVLRRMAYPAAHRSPDAGRI